MNLVDVMVGGLVFSLTSASSLQMYGSSLRWAHGQQQRQAMATAMELALSEGARTLGQQRDAIPATSDAAVGYTDCTSAAEVLVGVIEASSVPAGFSREARAEGEWVRLTVRAEGMPERRRWLSPAAYGLCGGPMP